MKKLLSFLPFLVLVFVIMTSAGAQNPARFGHIDTDELLRQMPGRDSAKAELERYARQLENKFISMQNEFQQKYQEFLADEGESELIKQSKQRELASLQERILEFQESAQEDLMRKEERLLSPIIDEARDAIEKVAKEYNYDYVFDTSTGVLLYSDPGDDIMPLVIKELGLD